MAAIWVRDQSGVSRHSRPGARTLPAGVCKERNDSRQTSLLSRRGSAIPVSLNLERLLHTYYNSRLRCIRIRCTCITNYHRMPWHNSIYLYGEIRRIFTEYAESCEEDFSTYNGRSRWSILTVLFIVPIECAIDLCTYVHVLVSTSYQYYYRYLASTVALCMDSFML